MKKNTIIDCHTHVGNERIYNEYFTKAKGRVESAIVMEDFEYEKLPALLELARGMKNLYVCAYVDIGGDIPSQLNVLEEHFKKKEIVGIKLYPGYQPFFPSDEKVYPIASLCQKYNKPLVFHSGDFDEQSCSGVRFDMCHPMHVQELASRFPDCKIVISHFGFPYCFEAANEIMLHKNVYTDISGTIVDFGSKSENRALICQYIKDLERIMAYFPGMKRKIMFGTDYRGEGTVLTQLDPVVKVVKKVFSKSDQKSVFHDLAYKLYLGLK